MEIFTLWLWPLLALILLPGCSSTSASTSSSAGIIFVDLALAQIAALGICVAIALGAHPGHDLRSRTCSRWCSRCSGRALFAWTRFNHPRVPQESIIGIIYVVAAAAATLVLSHSGGRGRGAQEPPRRQRAPGHEDARCCGRSASSRRSRSCTRCCARSS